MATCMEQRDPLKFPAVVDKCCENRTQGAEEREREKGVGMTTRRRRRKANFHTAPKKSKMMFPPFPACTSPAGGLDVISSIPTTSPHY